jgi:altronate dehydratase
VNTQESANERIATLTAGAIKSTTEAAIKAIWDAVEAAERKAKEMRQQAEEIVMGMEQGTSELADTVTSHITACQDTIDTFQAHHLKILNVEAPTKPNGFSMITDDTGRLHTLHEELSKK